MTAAGGPSWLRPNAKKSPSSRASCPADVRPTETEAAAAKAIAETGAASMKDMGKVMAVLKERYAGQMDFAAASATVKELLASPK